VTVNCQTIAQLRCLAASAWSTRDSSQLCQMSDDESLQLPFGVLRGLFYKPRSIAVPPKAFDLLMEV
jgi:hypothetical protein